MASQTRPQEVGKSYAFTRGRFDLPDAADHYATRHGGHRRDQREQRCIERALAGVPAGARVLDLPCGVGRLAPMLVKRGYELTQADVSAHMIEKARWAWTMHCKFKSYFMLGAP